VLAAACVPEDSHKLATYEIRPRFSVLATGDGKTQVTARLIAPDPDGFFDDDVRLDDHDRLFVTRIDPVDGAERRKLLHRRPGPVYQDTFTGDAQDTTFVIEFDRSRTGWTSAPDSHVTLPPALDLRWVEDLDTGSPAPTPFSRSSPTPLYVVWDPFEAPDFHPGDVLRFLVTGTCIQAYQGIVDWAGGESALDLTGVLVERPAPNDGSCPIRVELSVSRRGSVDAAYRGGSFVATQQRTLQLDSEP